MAGRKPVDLASIQNQSASTTARVQGAPYVASAADKTSNGAASVADLQNNGHATRERGVTGHWHTRVKRAVRGIEQDVDPARRLAVDACPGTHEQARWHALCWQLEAEWG